MRRIALLACAAVAVTLAAGSGAAAGPGENGKIVFSSNGLGRVHDLFAMAPDGTGQTQLTATPWIETQPVWSPDGSRLAFASTQNGAFEIHVANADGSGEVSLGPGSEPAWSPDGTQLAFKRNLRLWVVNADGSGARQVTSVKSSQPAWSPDGAWIVYVVNEHTSLSADVARIRPDGTGGSSLLATSRDETHPAYSPDGSRIAFAANDRVGGSDYDIWVMDADGTGPARLTSGSARDEWPAWSPDGSKLAFTSNREIEWEIFAMNADGTGLTNVSRNDTANDVLPDWGVAAGPPPDTTPPALSCGSADGLWHASDVAIACTATDEGAGLADAADASFSLSTSVPDGTETADATTGTREVCDAAGNCATAGPVGGNKVDRRAPSVVVLSPEATTYALGEPVGAQYSCADGGAGVASCDGPVASGAPLDTSTPGDHAFAVEATDGVGNAASASVTYTVEAPATAAELLEDLVASFDGQPLRAKALAAQAAVARGNVPAAENQLGALLHHVDAQAGKKLTDTEAAAIRELVGLVLDSLEQTAVEVCNGADDNGDGFVDEGFGLAFFDHGTIVCDASGFGTTIVCDAGYVDADGDPSTGCELALLELCGDGVDNDEDEVVDEGCAPDRFEPNDTAASATQLDPITLNTARMVEDLTLRPAGDDDWYAAEVVCPEFAAPCRIQVYVFRTGVTLSGTLDGEALELQPDGDLGQRLVANAPAGTSTLVFHVGGPAVAYSFAVGGF